MDVQQFWSLLVTLVTLATYVTSLTNPVDVKEDVTYPPDWVERCGDADGNITLFKKRAEVFEACYKKQFNVTWLIEGFVNARQQNTVHDFIRSQCMKIPEVETCLHEFVKSIEHCFKESEQKDMNITVDVMKALMEFVCYRDGERVLIFLQDEGMQCYIDQNANLQICINEGKEGFSNLTIPDELGYIASFSYSPATCKSIDELYKCMFNSLAKCSDRTPSLLFEALVKWILKKTPCSWKKVSNNLSPHQTNPFSFFVMFSVIIASVAASTGLDGIDLAFFV